MMDFRLFAVVLLGAAIVAPSDATFGLLKGGGGGGGDDCGGGGGGGGGGAGGMVHKGVKTVGAVEGAKLKLVHKVVGGIAGGKGGGGGGGVSDLAGSAGGLTGGAGGLGGSDGEGIGNAGEGVDNVAGSTGGLTGGAGGLGGGDKGGVGNAEECVGNAKENVGNAEESVGNPKNSVDNVAGSPGGLTENAGGLGGGDVGGVSNAEGVDNLSKSPDGVKGGAKKIKKGGSSLGNKKNKHWDLKPYKCCIGENWGGWFDDYRGTEDDISRVLKNVVQEILGWKKSNNVNSFVGNFLKVGLTLQRLINGIIDGLGTALWKVIASLLQLAVCLTSGLFDFIFGTGYKAKICAVGCAPQYGLGPGLSHGEVIGILDESWKECYTYWKRINNGKGWKGTSYLIEAILKVIDQVLSIGKECKDNGGITISVFVKLFSRLMIFITGSAAHYRHDSGLIEHLENIFDEFHEHGFDCNEIREYSNGCRSGHGLLGLLDIFHK